MSRYTRSQPFGTKPLPPHLLPHKSSHVCCKCGYRSPQPLLEVWSNANWHPICRWCLDDIGLGLLEGFTSGRDRPPVTGQLTMEYATIGTDRGEHDAT